MPGRPTPANISTKQERIATMAKQMPTAALRSLSHHMDLPWLREAFARTRKDGAVGVDGQTAAQYAEDLEGNLESLLNRAKSGLYRAPPVRRVHIPKGDGRSTRPLGLPTFEDKVLQRAVVMLMEPVYEEDFYDSSFGFRPARSAHDALEVLDKHLWRMRGGWVLDVDIKSFFDNLDHEKLRSILRQRVVDGVVVRLIGKWLRAGVLDEGVIGHPQSGTPQGGVISPLLANVYLHEVIDTWWHKEVCPRMRGGAEMVRYADDLVMVFRERRDAERVLVALAKRLGRFGLELHPDKTKLVRFKPPMTSGPGGGDGTMPRSFDFLGFNHHWGRSLKGRWIPKRKTSKSRFSRACRAVSQWLRRVRHRPVSEQAAMLGAKLRGHFNYYGIRGNSYAISAFRMEVILRWWKWLGRRSQRARLTWEAYSRLLERNPLPMARLPPGRAQLRLAKL